MTAQPLYTLTIRTSHPSGTTTYVKHGVTGFAFTPRRARVEYDDASPIAAVSIDLDGEVSEITLTPEPPRPAAPTEPPRPADAPYVPAVWWTLGYGAREQRVYVSPLTMAYLRGQVARPDVAYCWEAAPVMDLTSARPRCMREEGSHSVHIWHRFTDDVLVTWCVDGNIIDALTTLDAPW